MNSKINRIFILIVIILVCFTAILNQIIDKNGNLLNETFITQTTNQGNVQELVSKIKIAPAGVEDYDRGTYEAAAVGFAFKGQIFDSIRTYAYFASTNYDEKNDLCMSPYDNEWYKMDDMEYDHIIPLCYADQHGLNSLSNTDKVEYAYDPFCGVNVEMSQNRAKGSKGPSEWLPEENIEDYCYTWLLIAEKYNISIAQEDMGVIIKYINSVPESELNAINTYVFDEGIVDED